MEESNKIVNLLAIQFLSYRDMDEGYFKILKEIKRLNNRKIFIDISKVQEIAYSSKDVK